MKTMTTLIAFALASHGVLAQVQQAPASDTPSASGARTQPPLEAMPPATGPTGNVDGPPANPTRSMTVPQVETSGGSGMQSEAGLDNAPVTSTRLQAQTKNDVTYVCGGVGEEEASYMKQEARNHDLMMTFASRDGSYLADVNVEIRDAKGTPVLQTSCDGPILLVDLPRSGTYKVHAEAAGYRLDRTAKVQSKGQRNRVASVVLVFPQQVAEVETAPTSGSSSAGSRAGESGTQQSGQDKVTR